MRPVEDMSFEIGANERLGMVGESGSGKSLSSLSLLGLISSPGLHVSGTMEFDGVSLPTSARRSCATCAAGASA